LKSHPGTVEPEFQMRLSPSSTKHALHDIDISARALANLDWRAASVRKSAESQ
jgi:hypothetical protein